MLGVSILLLSLSCFHWILEFGQCVIFFFFFILFSFIVIIKLICSDNSKTVLFTILLSVIRFQLLISHVVSSNFP